MALTHAIHHPVRLMTAVHDVEHYLADIFAAASRSIRLFEVERDARSWLQTQLGSRAGR